MKTTAKPKKAPSKTARPRWFDKPIKSPGPWYAGACIHWLDKSGKMQCADDFPKKSQIMTDAEFLKRYGIAAKRGTTKKKKK